MSKILLAGDTHGSISHVRNVFAAACRQEAELIIQVGDYGYGWKFKQFKGTGGKLEDEFTHAVSELAEDTKIPFFFIDGNHENFDKLYEFPVSDSGLRHIAPSVSHVSRGTMLYAYNCRILCCGGALSIDQGHRTLGKSYWAQEEITKEDVERCAQAGPADVLLTHEAPAESSIIDRHLTDRWPKELTERSYKQRMLVSEILRNSKARFQFHGHHHVRWDWKSPEGVSVRGLSRDGEPISQSTFLLDTDEIPMLGSGYGTDPQSVDL